MTLVCWERTKDYIYWESNDKFLWGDFESLMQFRLIYEGPLFATTPGNNRAEHKHEIRRALHAQLKELWKTQPPLKAIYDHKIPMMTIPSGEKGLFRRLEEIARQHVRDNFSFVPLISARFGLACKLNILFLRRENPGDLVGHGGDLDNRIKTLFDALQIPKVLNGGLTPLEGEAPFFVLLEDDALITDMRVSTDRLLVPIQGESTSTHEKSNVHLVIHVETLIVNPAVSHIEFGLA